MTGWKTWAGVALLVIAGAAVALGYADMATTIYSVAIPMVIVGIGHKFDKVYKIMHMVAKGIDSAATEMEKASAALPAEEKPAEAPKV